MIITSAGWVFLFGIVVAGALFGVLIGETLRMMERLKAWERARGGS